MSTSLSSSGAGSVPCVLVVADPGRVTELADALEAPLPNGRVDVLRSSGGDDTIDLFESCSPRVVVLTATLEEGDAKSLIEAIREMVPRDQVVIVLVGDDATGVVRTALDAIDMKPDRFVSRPLAAKALRFAVQSGLDNVARALGESANGNGKSDDEDRDTGRMVSRGIPAETRSAETSGAVRVLRDNDSRHGTLETAAGSSPLILIGPRPSVAGAKFANLGNAEVIGDDPDEHGSGSVDITTDDIDERPLVPRTETPVRGSYSKSGPVELARPYPAVAVGRAPTDRGLGLGRVTPAEGVPANAPRPRSASGPLVARWEALADSIAHDEDDELGDDDVELLEDDVELLDDHAAPLPPIEVGPRSKGGTNPEFTPMPPVQPWRPGTTSALPADDDFKPPAREPTLIIADPLPLSPATSGSITVASVEPHSSLITPIPSLATPMPTPSMAERGPAERWSHPVLLSELIDRSRDSSRELLANVKDDLASIDDIDDGIIVGRAHTTPPPSVMRSGQLDALESLMEPIPPPGLGLETLTTSVTPPAPQPPVRPSSPLFGRAGSNFGGSGTSPGFTSGAGAAGANDAPAERVGAGRDFARQLRAKMSQMAQRLFQGDSPAQPQNVDIRPRHDHHTEIDLAALGEELVLGGGVTEIESRGAQSSHNEPPRTPGTSPGSWDTSVRERGLPDTGEIMRGVSDTPILLARMFAQSFTGRVGFRRDAVEKVVYFDQGRPVFASSNEPGDRMGELLVREGKITAAQYERCQVHVAQSGRRMGEILVDFGYLKRRELLPAVRRHVEDILYSLFSWDYGVYHTNRDTTASAERIRLSRHPASLVLEGIRRKLDRTTLEKLLGPSSTVIEIPDRDKLNSIINAGDLATEERTALGGFDGQADLAQIARNTSVDVADVLPLAWGLCALGLATARRTEPTFSDESTALVGETDLAIDRERVRARWQLVTDADYFALLGVRRDATGFEIRRAYQAARRDFASDCFPGDLRRELARELEDIATVLDEAFRVLRDDRLRVTYLSNLVE